MVGKISTSSDSFKCLSTNVCLSLTLVCVCLVNFFFLDGLLKCGKINSPVLLIAVAFETLRWALNKFSFGLDANTREVAISSTRNNNTNNVSLISNVKNVCKFSVLLLMATLAYAVLCILMGASYYSSFEETIVLSALLTSLTIFPVGLFLGPTKTLQYLFYDSFELTYRREVTHLELLQYNVLGTLIGAWAGSVVVPLDWDRDWQTYPIPNIIGALVGFTLANVHSIGCAAFDMVMNIPSGEKKST